MSYLKNLSKILIVLLTLSIFISANVSSLNDYNLPFLQEISNKLFSDFNPNLDSPYSEFITDGDIKNSNQWVGGEKIIQKDGQSVVLKREDILDEEGKYTGRFKILANPEGSKAVSVENNYEEGGFLFFRRNNLIDSQTDMKIKVDDTNIKQYSYYQNKKDGYQITDVKTLSKTEDGKLETIGSQRMASDSSDPNKITIIDTNLGKIFTFDKKENAVLYKTKDNYENDETLFFELDESKKLKNVFAEKLDNQGNTLYSLYFPKDDSGNIQTPIYSDNAPLPLTKEEQNKIWKYENNQKKLASYFQAEEDDRQIYQDAIDIPDLIENQINLDDYKVYPDITGLVESKNNPVITSGEAQIYQNSLSILTDDFFEGIENKYWYDDTEAGKQIIDLPSYDVKNNLLSVKSGGKGSDSSAYASLLKEDGYAQSPVVDKYGIRKVWESKVVKYGDQEIVYLTESDINDKDKSVLKSTTQILQGDKEIGKQFRTYNSVDGSSKLYDLQSDDAGFVLKTKAYVPEFDEEKKMMVDKEVSSANYLLNSDYQLYASEKKLEDGRFIQKKYGEEGLKESFIFDTVDSPVYGKLNVFSAQYNDPDGVELFEEYRSDDGKIIITDLQKYGLDGTFIDGIKEETIMNNYGQVDFKTEEKYISSTEIGQTKLIDYQYDSGTNGYKVIEEITSKGQNEIKTYEFKNGVPYASKTTYEKLTVDTSEPFYSQETNFDTTTGKPLTIFIDEDGDGVHDKSLIPDENGVIHDSSYDQESMVPRDLSNQIPEHTLEPYYNSLENPTGLKLDTPRTPEQFSVFYEGETPNDYEYKDQPRLFLPIPDSSNGVKVVPVEILEDDKPYYGDWTSDSKEYYPTNDRPYIDEKGNLVDPTKQPQVVEEQKGYNPYDDPFKDSALREPINPSLPDSITNIPQSEVDNAMSELDNKIMNQPSTLGGSGEWDYNSLPDSNTNIPQSEVDIAKAALDDKILNQPSTLGGTGEEVRTPIPTGETEADINTNKALGETPGEAVNEIIGTGIPSLGDYNNPSLSYTPQKTESIKEVQSHIGNAFYYLTKGNLSKAVEELIKSLPLVGIFLIIFVIGKYASRMTIFRSKRGGN